MATPISPSRGTLAWDLNSRLSTIYSVDSTLTLRGPSSCSSPVAASTGTVRSLRTVSSSNHQSCHLAPLPSQRHSHRPFLGIP